MKTAAMTHVECAILHLGFQPVAADDILLEIQKALAVYDFAGELSQLQSSNDWNLDMIAGNYRIKISQNDQPLGMAGFETALSTPYTGMILPDARNIVAGHAANSLISIARIDLNSGTAAAIDDADEVLRVMRLCAHLTAFITQYHPASAIHWCPADNLVSQQYFDSIWQSDDLTPLYVRPYLFSSTGLLADGYPFGMLVSGSQFLIGNIIEFAEAPVSMPWMMGCVIVFIHECQQRGAVLADGETFTIEGQDIKLLVRQEPIEGHSDWGKIVLMTLHAPQFGIIEDDQALIAPQHLPQAAILAEAAYAEDAAMQDDEDLVSTSLTTDLPTNHMPDDDLPATDLPTDDLPAGPVEAIAQDHNYSPQGLVEETAMPLAPFARPDEPTGSTGTGEQYHASPILPFTGFVDDEDDDTPLEPGSVHGLIISGDHAVLDDDLMDEEEQEEFAQAADEFFETPATPAFQPVEHENLAGFDQSGSLPQSSRVAEFVAETTPLAAPQNLAENNDADGAWQQVLPPAVASAELPSTASAEQIVLASAEQPIQTFSLEQPALPDDDTSEEFADQGVEEEPAPSLIREYQPRYLNTGVSTKRMGIDSLRDFALAAQQVNPGDEPRNGAKNRLFKGGRDIFARRKV